MSNQVPACTLAAFLLNACLYMCSLLHTLEKELAGSNGQAPASQKAHQQAWQLSSGHTTMCSSLSTGTAFLGAAAAGAAAQNLGPAPSVGDMMGPKGRQLAFCTPTVTVREDAEGMALVRHPATFSGCSEGCA